MLKTPIAAAAPSGSELFPLGAAESALEPPTTGVDDPSAAVELPVPSCPATVDVSPPATGVAVMSPPAVGVSTNGLLGSGFALGAATFTTGLGVTVGVVELAGEPSAAPVPVLELSLPAPGAAGAGSEDPPSDGDDSVEAGEDGGLAGGEAGGVEVCPAVGFDVAGVEGDGLVGAVVGAAGGAVEAGAVDEACPGAPKTSPSTSPTPPKRPPMRPIAFSGKECEC